ncbi:type I restriction-modification system subunit M N-terminal domain-containing protein [Propionimicrobium sp. BV2F7]|uniref:type I restriction-modification system subunit M N-terminal domain-containing protein n=1 Tax=Propionimicrobium sp. BV2F7 TaxID=1111131 RepID=UPI0018CC41E2|nr:type I restriction-modification system subunit M N-terminal domain-containing protein [Propionimicrobium sp. BV2F7]
MSTADIPRAPSKASQYSNVILPMMILRRLNCVLTDHQTTIEPLVARFNTKPELLAAQVQRSTGLPFYNTSPWTLRTLLGDPEMLEANLKQYVNDFSDNMDVFERLKLADEISTMAEKKILYLVVERFANIDLHPDTVSNAEMGDLYEYLIRTFNEPSNDALSTPGIIRTICDWTLAPSYCNL